MKKPSAWSLALSLPFALACQSEPKELPASESAPAPQVDAAAPPVSAQAALEEKAKKELDARKLDYGEALRSAALKLVGDLPTLAEIKDVEANGKVSYEKAIDGYLADTRFATQMLRFFRETFRTGGDGKMDFAARFAAMLVVEDRPYTELFTAKSGTCPTFDAEAGKFTAGDCAQSATAGVLTDAGLMTQYFGNMAFRRARFVQETFACSKFPAEFSSAPIALGGGAYTSPWKIETIAGGPGSKIDFRDTASVLCANCHTTLNHQAPLFATFDEQGALTPSIQVKVPVSGNPTATLTDWLAPGEKYYWRAGGAPVEDLTGLGQEIAKDPNVSLCATNRFWNYALSRGDIVADLATIPDIVTKGLAEAFAKNGFKVRPLVRAVFTSDDFVKF